jgi:hypothetical protein
LWRHAEGVLFARHAEGVLFARHAEGVLLAQAIQGGVQRALALDCLAKSSQ